jgi:GMP synthase-like glutamine amidotransferase
VSALAIVFICIGAVLLVMFAGGAVAAGRRRSIDSSKLHAELAAADAALAEARAQDRGWERATIEAAARAAFSARHDGADPVELHLVQVVDRPGTDSDLAVFRALGHDGAEETISLGRREGAWVAAESL